MLENVGIALQFGGVCGETKLFLVLNIIFGAKIKSNREKHCKYETHRTLHMKLVINQSPSSMQPRTKLQ